MLNLARAIRMMNDGGPPTSNDPHMQIRYNNLIWGERNGINVGRCIMAWLAIAGWAAFAISVCF